MNNPTKSYNTTAVFIAACAGMAFFGVTMLSLAPILGKLNAVVGEGAVVAAGALVLGKTIIGPHEIWGGVPAKFIKKTSADQAESYARHYVEYSKWYLEEDGKV